MHPAQQTFACCNYTLGLLSSYLSRGSIREIYLLIHNVLDFYYGTPMKEMLYNGYHILDG